MNLDRGIPVKFGPLEGAVFGGQFRKFVPGTRRLCGVKMAVEINHPHDINIPTEDFDVPSVPDMQAGMIAALDALKAGKDIYAGCMGGIGRTGLFMGCMAKLMADYELLVNPDAGLSPELADPVRYVRSRYTAHAIETREQQAYVRQFDTAPVLEHLWDILHPPVEVREVEVPVKTFPGLLEYALWWVSGGFRG